MPPSCTAGASRCLLQEMDAAVLYGRSFTLLTTEDGCRRLVRPELHVAYYKGRIRRTAAEQNVFQQTAALPRLNQNATGFRARRNSCGPAALGGSREGKCVH